MSSGTIANLTTMMETFRIAFLVLIPIYGFAFAAIKQGETKGVAWASELLFMYPQQFAKNKTLILLLIPLWIVLRIINPLLLFVILALTIIVYIAFLSQMNSEEEESSIDKDLKGVVLKRDRKNLPKRKVRLEKITTEKEYVETGEIGVDTDVEWKWRVKNVLTKTGIIRNNPGENSQSEDANFDREKESDSENCHVDTVPEISLSEIIEKSKSRKRKTKPGAVEIKDAGPSIINAITNVKFYRKPFIEHDEEYTIFNMDSQEKYKSISGKLLQQLLEYTGKWDESFNNHDMYFVSGIDPYNEHELTSELVSFIKEVLEMDDEVQLRWVYRTPL